MNRQLFELQEADNTIARLRRERAKLDDGTAARADRDTLHKAFETERENQQRIHTERMDKELKLKATEEKIARQNSRLMSATSAHEVEALQRDITGLNKSRGDLDEAILILMDEGEAGTTRLAALGEELKAKNALLRQTEENFASETTRIEKEISATQVKRDALAKAIEPAHMQKYDALAKRFHGVAITHPEKGSCVACGMTLTPFNLKEAKTKEWPTCEGCGRLLFVE